MKKTIGMVLFLALSGIAVSANSAIVYLADGRYINHTLGGTYTPAAPYADFNADWWAWEAGAFQNTSVTSTTMSGSGSTYAGADAMHYGAEATSLFDVTFSVDQLSDFTLTGSLDTGWWSLGGLNVVLIENNIPIFGLDLWDLPNSGVNPFSFTGQFLVGNTYQLRLYSYSFDSNYYDEMWQFDLITTSAVPVPAAAWLFGSGLVGLLGATRRKATQD